MSFLFKRLWVNTIVFFNSKRWEYTDIKEKSQYYPLPLYFSTGENEELVNRTVNKSVLKIHHSGKY